MCCDSALQSAGQLPEAFVVLGFAFYLQPMMMPLLHDMPPGPAGLAITSTAVKIVILGTPSRVRMSCGPPCTAHQAPSYMPHHGIDQCCILQN